MQRKIDDDSRPTPRSTGNWRDKASDKDNEPPSRSEPSTGGGGRWKMDDKQSSDSAWRRGERSDATGNREKSDRFGGRFGSDRSDKPPSRFDNDDKGRSAFSKGGDRKQEGVSEGIKDFISVFIRRFLRFDSN